MPWEAPQGYPWGLLVACGPPRRSARETYEASKSIHESFKSWPGKLSGITCGYAMSWEAPQGCPWGLPAACGPPKRSARETYEAPKSIYELQLIARKAICHNMCLRDVSGGSSGCPWALPAVCCTTRHPWDLQGMDWKTLR